MKNAVPDLELPELRAQGSAALQEGLEERLIAEVRAAFDGWRAEEDAAVGDSFEQLCSRFWKGIQNTVDELLPGTGEELCRLAENLSLHVITADTFGNGRSDRKMLAAAGLGIAVMQQEGTAVETLLAASVVVPDIGAALGLLLYPMRLVATLRR